MKHATKYSLLAITCILFIAIYFPLPKGLMTIIASAAIIMSLIIMNPPTRGIALTLYSGPLFGIMFMLWGIPLPGYITAVTLGFIILRKNLKEFFLEKNVIIALIVVFFLFFLFFLIGPMHEYSTTKIIRIIIIGAITGFSWMICFKSEHIETTQLAQYILLTSLFIISTSFDFFSFTRPNSFFDFDFFRNSFRHMINQPPFTYHTVGIPALESFAFLLCTKYLKKLKEFSNILLLILCLFIIAIAQARQAIVGVLAVVVLRVFIEKRIGTIQKVFAILFFSSLIIYGILSLGSEAVEKSLTAQNSAELLNRDYTDINEQTNMQSDEMLFGKGLGGYSKTGERAYPHNIILELYYETGAIGILIFTTLLLLPFVQNPRKLTRTSKSDFYMLIPITCLLIRALASSDLTENITFISAIIVLAYTTYSHKRFKKTNTILI